MASGDYLTFNLNGNSTGTPSPEPVVQVKIIDNGDGTLTFQVQQMAGATVGDISAFWFDVADESLIGTLQAIALPSPTGVGTPSISLAQGNDTVQDLNGQDNLQGVGYGSDGGFDVGIDLNQTPDQIDDFLSFSFTLSSSTQALSLADFQNVDFGIRITAAGSDTDGDGDGDGPGSWKILGTSTSGMPELSIDKVVTGVFNADGSADEDSVADSAGDYITYDVKVANTGNITLTGVSINDPLLGGAMASDLTLGVGGEHTASGSYTVTQADLDSRGDGDGSIDNTATADSAETDPQSDSEHVGLLYDPEVDIEKFVRVSQDGIWTDWQDADSGPGPIADQDDAIEFKFVVTNQGNITLTNVEVVDSVYDLNGAANGSAYGLGTLGVGENESFVFTGATFQSGQHTNVGTVTTAEGATDSDAANFYGTFDGPGVRTPGFWANNGLQFWDGKAFNQTKAGENFPSKELAYDPDDAGRIPADNNIDGDEYIVLNDDGDGLVEAGELGVLLSDGVKFVNASMKQQEDGRWMLARDAVATELNFLAGNPGADANPSTVDPQHLLAEAVKWLDFYGDTNNDNWLSAGELTSATKVTASSTSWNTPVVGNEHSAAILHNQLDSYNNDGIVFGVQFAKDGDLLV